MHGGIGFSWNRLRSMVSLFSFLIASLGLTACGPDGQLDEWNLDGKVRIVKNPKGTLVDDAHSEKNWFTKDPKVDGLEGASVDLAYARHHLENGAPIIVAVIDSGVDVDHEDLQSRIWTNRDEIPGNGIDDDNNGYVDDLHGWNFLGSYNKQGEPINLEPTTLEITRELVRMEKLKEERKRDRRTLSKKEKEYLSHLSKEFSDAHAQADGGLKHFGKIRKDLKKLYGKMKDEFNVRFEDLTLELVQSIQPKKTDKKTHEKLVKVFNNHYLKSVRELDAVIHYYQNSKNVYYNKEFDPRKTIIGDNLNDFSDTNYGNNDVEGPDASHGTHVAGIIAAVRGNSIGIDGVATQVEIMSLRAVPNGDEYDKDVANAVRYAVDNGARIINMSFGKSYSPGKKGVDAAFQYAAEKNVLIVHAAGNSSTNIDWHPTYPNRDPADGNAQPIAGWIEVGASAPKKSARLPASFTNYGKYSVDLFAPGVAIESTVPKRNQYAVYSGTSMAAPVVSGVAALVWAQFPELTARDIKRILKNSSRRYPKLRVYRPYTIVADTMMWFSSLSETGGIVDANVALEVAQVARR